VLSSWKIAEKWTLNVILKGKLPSSLLHFTHQKTKVLGQWQFLRAIFERKKLSERCFIYARSYVPKRKHPNMLNTRRICALLYTMNTLNLGSQTNDKVKGSL